MKDNFPNGRTLGEGVPEGRIETFANQGRRLFEAAERRFGVIGIGIGRADAKILDSARYQAKERDLVTIRDSATALETDESASGSVAVTIETSLPWSPGFQNAYVRETFIFPGFGDSEAYEYSLGVSEYTLDGDRIVQTHPLEDVRQAYSQEMQPFQAECTPEHFTNQMLTLVLVEPGDEVGCEPNPYRQIDRG